MKGVEWLRLQGTMKDIMMLAKMLSSVSVGIKMNKSKISSKGVICLYFMKFVFPIC